MLLSVLLRCGNLRDTLPQSPFPVGKAAYPHPENWTGVDVHGKFVIDYGTSSCTGQCHGDQLDGANGPGCKSCHSIYPHPEPSAWDVMTGHGQYISDNGLKTCQTSCHGTNLDGGYNPQGKKSCEPCHSSYPQNHTDPLWAEQKHGQFVLQLGGATDCVSKCHRVVSPASIKIPLCSSCHNNYPHSTDWNLANQHGTKAISDIDDCKLCHKSLSSADCKSCHHDNNSSWISTDHKTSARVSTNGCQICHGSDLKGGEVGVSCFNCHNNYPHPSDWATATQHGTAATTDISNCKLCHISITSQDCKSCHHDNDTNWRASNHQRAAAQNINGCKICHGGDLTGGDSGISCYSCHASFSSHPADWALKSQHGVAATADINSCINCHGLITSQSCKSCHHDSDTNWLATNHKTSAAADNSGCKTCHGADFTGGLSGISCYSCHSNYPHPSNWSTKAQHGTAATSSISGCNVCHTSPVSSGCTSCHHNNDLNWQNTNHMVTARTDTSGCKICHGSDLKGGVAGTSCYSCHDPGNVYPHPGNIASGGVHPDMYDSNPSNCRTACHGTNLLGGISTKRCNRCHGIP